MLDEDLARIRAHRNNLYRYRRLLETRLSDIERQFIERRLAEEQAALAGLVRNDLPGSIFDTERQPTSAGSGTSCERSSRSWKKGMFTDPFD
jgi:hypothetical protein